MVNTACDNSTRILILTILKIYCTFQRVKALVCEMLYCSYSFDAILLMLWCLCAELVSIISNVMAFSLVFFV